MQLLLLFTCVLLTNNVTAIPLSDFYQFGSGAGDSLLHRNDDESSPAISVPSGFAYFGQFFGDIFVS